MIPRRQPTAPAFGPDMGGMAAPPPLQFAPPPQDTGPGNMEQAMSGLTHLMGAIRNRPQMNAGGVMDAPLPRRRPGFSGPQSDALNNMANA